MPLWFVTYFIFIIFFTGPKNLSLYPDPTSSPYKLPWKEGVARFVAQGNNSFTSHRNLHLHAWDFIMANGTPVLAARGGEVDEVVQNFDGIGFDSNYIHIRHDDGSVGGYAHIKKDSSFVKVGEKIYQGQPIALSGMVGQTIMPHLHFYVLDEEKTASLPISFIDVPEGVPLAGRFYTSNNFDMSPVETRLWPGASNRPPLNKKRLAAQFGAVSQGYEATSFSFEPEIQCTVIEIEENTKIFGIDIKQFDSISNDATQSKLAIANQLINKKPKLIKKSKETEEIEIFDDSQKIILKIHGEPISRNGTLELNGEQIAKITCH